MAGSRTLKLNILAETADLVNGLKKADDATKSAGDRIKNGFKVVGAAALAAGAAVGAFAVKLAVDGVKAAIEDEAAQVRLATALKNTTGATNEQIASIEKQILATSLATGVADDELRPALSRLAIATGDSAKSQELLNLALDISAATGKDLESVSQALGKAYEGNTTSLGRLGIGLGAADIKALGLEGTVKQLSDTFGGAAATQAETFQGRMARLTVAIDETKEGIGAALLPILTELFGYVNTYVVPLVTKLASSFEGGVSPAVDKARMIFTDFFLPAVKEVWEFLQNLFTPILSVLTDGYKAVFQAVKNNSESLQPLLNLLKAVWAFIKDFLAPVLGTALKAAFLVIANTIEIVINALARFIDFIKPVINLVTDLFNGISRVAGFLGIGGGKSSPVQSSGFGNIQIPGSGSINTVPTIPSGAAGGNRPTVVNNNTVNVSGTVVDPEGTARAVAKVVNNSVNRSGGLSVGGGTNRFGLLAVT